MPAIGSRRLTSRCRRARHKGRRPPILRILICRHNRHPGARRLPPEAGANLRKESRMAAKVTARIDYVVQAANGTGLAFEPYEEMLALPIEEFNVESKEQIIAANRKVVLALRPVADGKYQMMRRKADVKLSSDAKESLRLRQIALKVQFEKSNQSAAVAAYPITKDIEFKQSELT